MTWFYAFLAFAALVILHEFGHFAAAKSVGMKVEKFSLFFPPALGKIQRGETSYQIGAIPLGGYVKITGMNPEEEIPPEDLPRAYFMQPVWKRIVTIGAGPAMNFLIALILFFILYAMVGETITTNQIAKVDQGSPAAGKLVPGDHIVAINGKRGGPDAFNKQIRATKCVGKPTAGCPAKQPVSVTIDHNGTKSTFTTTPKYDASRKLMRLGLSWNVAVDKRTPVAAIGASFGQMWFVTKATVALPARIFDSQGRKEIHGTAASYELTQKQFSYHSTEQVIRIIALISLSLALINLFPFLPLDGGHIFWALAEKVRGKPIPVPVLERASIVGIALIAMLFLIGLSNDINYFQTGKLGP